MNVVGLDLSLTATGAAWPDGRTSTLALKLTGVERLDAFYGWAADTFVAASSETRDATDLVAIEGYSFSSRHSQAHALGELGGVIRLALHHAGVPYIEIPPTVVKKYATGKGTASKDEVLSAAIRAGADETVTTNDRADAWWLRAIGLHLHDEPVVAVTTYRTAVVDKLKEGK